MGNIWTADEFTQLAENARELNIYSLEKWRYDDSGDNNCNYSDQSYPSSTSGAFQESLIYSGDGDSAPLYCTDIDTAFGTHHRKQLNLLRWYCVSRPQYVYSCGISCVVSVWNYLFSTLGTGEHRPITQEEALLVLGHSPPFQEIHFGPTTGNLKIMKWFKQLSDHYGVKGRCAMLYKIHGLMKTPGLTEELALEKLKSGLRSDTEAFIYHCENHYICPVGYEDTPISKPMAYNASDEDCVTWILIADTSRLRPVITSIKWETIVQDLSCQNPDYLNIRELHRGIQRRKKEDGNNMHGIMVFRKNADRTRTTEETLPKTCQQNSVDNIANAVSSVTWEEDIGNC